MASRYYLFDRTHHIMSSTTPGGSTTSPGAFTDDSGSQARETFNTRLVFLMAAIGSAVGLGNIWRSPTSPTTPAAVPSSSLI